MSTRRDCAALLSSMLCILVTFTTSWGQENASLPDLGVEITIPALGDVPVPLSPEMAASGKLVHLAQVEQLYIPPLRWELEKHQIYMNLITEEITSLEKERAEAIAEQEQLVSELTGFGITSLEQLDEKRMSFQGAKLEAAVLEAESAALRDAVEQRKESIASQGREKAVEAIDLQKKLIGLAESKMNLVANEVRNGVIATSRLAEAEAEVIRARRELALMEAEAIQQKDPILDAILGRLAEIEPRRKATDAKMETFSELTANAGQIRQLIHESERAERELNLLKERRNQLVARLWEQNLRTKYLEEILQRYESSLKKAAPSPPAEKDE